MTATNDSNEDRSRLIRDSPDTHAKTTGLLLIYKRPTSYYTGARNREVNREVNKEVNKEE
jgi:hypothetical protein